MSTRTLLSLAHMARQRPNMAVVDMDMISLGIATMTVSYVLCSVATLPIKEREYDASKVSAELE